MTKDKSMDCDVQELLTPLVEETRSMWNDECVALYVYGSAVRGNMDAWSDLDLLLICKDTEKSRPFFQEWYKRVRDVALPRPITVDASVIRVPYLKEPNVDYGSMLLSLKDDSWLLLGDDVRSEIVTPSQELLRQVVLDSMWRYVINRYGLPNDPLPATLPPLEISCEAEPTKWSPAWQVSMTVIQILRAFLFFETGALHHKKGDLLPAFQKFGDEGLADICAKALQCRKIFPRMGAIRKLAPPLPELVDVVPKLVSRLAASVQQRGLEELYAQFWH